MSMQVNQVRSSGPEEYTPYQWEYHYHKRENTPKVKLTPEENIKYQAINLLFSTINFDNNPLNKDIKSVIENGTISNLTKLMKNRERAMAFNRLERHLAAANSSDMSECVSPSQGLGDITTVEEIHLNGQRFKKWFPRHEEELYKVSRFIISEHDIKIGRELALESYTIPAATFTEEDIKRLDNNLKEAGTFKW